MSKSKTPKIQSVTISFFDFYELVEQVDAVLGSDQRNCGKIFYPDRTDFYSWHKSKNYP